MTGWAIHQYPSAIVDDAEEQKVAVSVGPLLPARSDQCPETGRPVLLAILNGRSDDRASNLTAPVKG